jgi:3-hydroxyacyl-CoA dehydrogenase
MLPSNPEPRDRHVRVITLDNPPVNALSFAYCKQLLDEIRAAHADDAVEAIVITGANGLFSAGADVNDFQNELPPQAVTIRDVIAAIEASVKTHVAAIDGNCLGAGLELSLACDYRVATPNAKLGLPEIRLGLLPGAGGTQRLPRLIGARAALELMLKGSSVSAERAHELGIVDDVIDSRDLIARAKELAKGPKRRVSERLATIAKDVPLQAAPYVVAQAHKMVPSEENGGLAAHKLIDAVQAGVELPFNFGLARETRLFDELVRSKPSLALRHLFFAERELDKIPGVSSFDSAQDDKHFAQDDKPSRQDDMKVERVGVVGAGTMGTGIAIAFAQAGIPVVVVDNNDEAVDKARQTVMGMFMYQVQKGRLTQEEAWKRGQSIRFTDDWNELADCDLVVEAVFEDLEVKRDVFRKLDAIARPGAILASNTSTLDIDKLAGETRRPERVLGLHFFVPANIMPLLEIVRGRDTSPRVLATAFKLAKLLRKKGVLSGNAFGFIGNRMIFDYVQAATALAEEGVPVARIDAVMKRFGFPMGPFAMSDLSGLDIGLAVQKAGGAQTVGRTHALERLVEMKRLGQKTMAGFFRYDKGVGKGREPIPDPLVDRLFAEEARKAGVTPRDVSDDAIRDRLLGALINRGQKLLDEGIALRPGDIDVVYVYGYGFPPHRGGPMWYAQHPNGGVALRQAQGDTRQAQGDARQAQGDTIHA